ncbi:unnamed protein product [Hymenolepis diminuta]|uniref:Uncharacterized protein n=1 Tax=Hymenolepis diminuta TaxID=6216 RepID=A0A564ZCJ4_HYMDI|nr:unnamed protein product [Hymenolepis diminuta]
MEIKALRREEDEMKIDEDKQASNLSTWVVDLTDSSINTIYYPRKLMSRTCQPVDYFRWSLQFTQVKLIFSRKPEAKSNFHLLYVRMNFK